MLLALYLVKTGEASTAELLRLNSTEMANRHCDGHLRFIILLPGGLSSRLDKVIWRQTEQGEKRERERMHVNYHHTEQRHALVNNRQSSVCPINCTHGGTSN